MNQSLFFNESPSKILRNKDFRHLISNPVGIIIKSSNRSSTLCIKIDFLLKKIKGVSIPSQNFFSSKSLSCAYRIWGVATPKRYLTGSIKIIRNSSNIIQMMKEVIHEKIKGKKIQLPWPFNTPAPGNNLPLNNRLSLTVV